jgi:hypothetical protein
MGQVEGVGLKIFLISYFSCIYLCFHVICQIFVLCFIYVAKNFIKGSAEIFEVQKISMSKNINGQITGDMDESCR